MNARIFSLVAMAAVLAGSGCVSVGTHKKKIEELNAERLRNEELAVRLERAEAAATERASKESTAAEQAARVAEVRETYDRLIDRLKEEMSEGNVDLSADAGRVVISLGDNILFRSGRARLQPEGKKVLGKVAAVLVSSDAPYFRIEGHTDSLPIKGRLADIFPTNWDLSAARAASVVSFLKENGVDPAKMILAAYAHYRPIASNATPEGRKRNRRVEIALIRADEGNR